MKTYIVNIDGLQMKVELYPDEVEALKQDQDITIIEA